MQKILITTLVVTVLSAVFAFILSIAEKYLNDYGEVKVLINDDKELIVEGGQSLLTTLVDQKIFIPSACGGKGTCGYCKCKVIDGAGPILATEKPWLSEEEQAENIRLSCQVKVKNDISIEIPEELFNVKEYETTLETKEMLTDRIARIRLALPEGETINFKPGQFIQLKTEAYPSGPDYEGSDEEVFRAYSIASSIKDDKHIELLIGYTKGICTTYVHKILNEGDKVTINGPYGDFFYADDDNDEIIMSATGTGFAPIRSILYHMLDNDIKKKTRFYFGSRTPDDLFLLDELKMFEEKLYDFKFMPVLSRASKEDGWDGDTGYINDSIKKYVDENTTYTAYLCGSPVVIAGVKEDLMNKGLKEEYIKFDEF